MWDPLEQLLRLWEVHTSAQGCPPSPLHRRWEWCLDAPCSLTVGVEASSGGCPSFEAILADDKGVGGREDADPQLGDWTCLHYARRAHRLHQGPAQLQVWLSSLSLSFDTQHSSKVIVPSGWLFWCNPGVQWWFAVLSSQGDPCNLEYTHTSGTE